jgi:putative colanic acid biosynthesis UDP-glucose lipid carrier transferase
MYTVGNVQATRLGISLDNICPQCRNTVYAFIKRAMDIVLPLAGLIVLSPVMLLIAAGIKISSPGPVFYKQKRCTKNGQEFWLYKFRSMPHQIEKDNKPVWGARNDSRSTWFGNILRITGLDELPQLINIISGEMSLVGPRPERPYFIQKFRKTINNYDARLNVKAGLTGWAQVNGYRGTTSIVKRLEHDIFYMKNRSILFDLIIILMTPFSMKLAKTVKD